MLKRISGTLMLIASCIACEQGRPPLVTDCTNCSIELARVGEFSDTFEPGVFPDAIVHADRDSRGRIFTTSKRHDVLYVFGSDGKFLQELGKSGDGPGEFRRIRRVFIGMADSLYVTDWSQRVHVYTADLRFHHTQQLRAFPSLILGDGSFIVTDPISAPGSSGFPVHRMFTDGSFGTSFGKDSLRSEESGKLLATRLVTHADGNNVWTVAPGRYVIEQWNVETGKRIRSLPIGSTWFKELSQWPADERVRPPAVIESLHMDDGVLWVLFRDSDVDWQPPEHANEERMLTLDEYDKTYDWVVEAVNSESGQVMATKRFRNLVVGRAPSRFYVTHRSGSTENAVFEVWRPVLRRDPAK